MSDHQQLFSSPDDETPVDSPVFLLLLPEGENRRLLTDWLSSWGDVRTGTTPDAIDDDLDLCFVDWGSAGRFEADLRSHRESTAPVFLPYVLLQSGDVDELPPRAWNLVDDVVQTPIRKRLLRARLVNLLSRRASSLRLRERERQLQAALDDLRLAKRAMDEAPVGITIAGPLGEGAPVEYVNDEFLDLTGYDADSVLGYNLRLLQGRDTDPETRATIHDALADRESVSVDILNYTRSNARFWNHLDIAPISDHEETHFVGFQTDVTERKLREQRLDVLNRVLRHNLRNEMNIVTGYADVLSESVSDPRARNALARIRRAASRLTELSEEVYRTEAIFDSLDAEREVELATLCEQLRRGIGPDVALVFELPDETVQLVGRNLTVACHEIVETLAEYDPSNRKTVRIHAAVDGIGVDLTIADHDSELPTTEWRVVTRGEETPLEHTDRIRLWLAHWILSLAGGDLRFEESEAGPTAHVWLPRQPHDRRT